MERSAYVGACREVEYLFYPHKLMNLSILCPLKICGILSRTGYRLSEIRQFELRRMVELRRTFTQVPDKLHKCVADICRQSLVLTREQWKVILPTLQDHFPSVPRKFYLLLIKLSLGLGFLTTRLCGKNRHLCPFIFRRVFTTRLVRSKYARALRLNSREKEVNQPNWLNVFFPNPNFW